MSSVHVLPDGAAVAFDCVQPGLLFELRVLSGLHEGAALPLFGERWSIGAHQNADLELYDPGVEVRHAHLHCRDGRWTVQAQEGLLQDKGGTARAQIADLAPGTAFSIGGIQLCVANTQSGWVQEPAPVPGVQREALPGLQGTRPAGGKRKWLVALPGVLVLILTAAGFGESV